MTLARSLLVFVDRGRPRLAGRLHAHVDGDHEWAEFEPDRRWRTEPDAALCAPMFETARGAQRNGANMPLFGAVGDSAPDRWGRTLMRRMERRKAARASRSPDILRETDFLLGVDDDIRVGCLRFRERERGPFMGNRGSRKLPRVRDIPKLVRAVHAHETDRETMAQAELLLVSGQLLGGSRPKATFIDEQGALCIAKFASHGDGRDMQRWEAVVLSLASACGIDVPPFNVVTAEGERVLVMKRFDRTQQGGRLGVISAYGLLAAQDNEAGSYLAMARVLKALGARPEDDLRELWRRAVFTVFISDKDNHLRNHGLILRDEGWRLCPAYDMNAEAEPLKPRQLLLSLDGVDDRASLDIAFSVCGEFGLAFDEARAEARRIAQVIAGWRESARRLRLPRGEIDRMKGAFESDALRTALRLRVKL